MQDAQLPDRIDGGRVALFQEFLPGCQAPFAPDLGREEVALLAQGSRHVVKNLCEPRVAVPQQAPMKHEVLANPATEFSMSSGGRSISARWSGVSVSRASKYRTSHCASVTCQ